MGELKNIKWTEILTTNEKVLLNRDYHYTYPKEKRW